MKGSEINKSIETSNTEGGGVSIKIVPQADIEGSLSIKNEEDKTNEIVDEYIKKNIEDIIRKRFDGEIVPQMKKEVTKEVKSKIERESGKLRDNLFTLFGIFASVVTFIFTEIQILKNATSWQTLIGISLIILGALVFFILLIKFILLLNEDFSWKENKTGVVAIIILFIISIFFIIFGVYFASTGGNIGADQHHGKEIFDYRNIKTDSNIYLKR